MERGQMQQLLNEVQALARYNHQHIVRYYHAWLETQPVVTSVDDVWSEEEQLIEEDPIPSKYVPNQMIEY